MAVSALGDEAKNRINGRDSESLNGVYLVSSSRTPLFFYSVIPFLRLVHKSFPSYFRSLSPVIFSLPINHNDIR